MPQFVLADSPVSSRDHRSAQAAEIEGALALGRLDGALGACPPTTLRLFAATLLRDTLMAALRQEGHPFTEQRFHAWFAGLVTLSDQPPRLARPPRALCEALLTEMTHSSWEPLASLAARLLPALPAPQDLYADEAHEEAHAVVTAARRLIESWGQDRSALPFPALAILHHAVSQDVTFAPAERSSEPATMGVRRRMVERTRAPSRRAGRSNCCGANNGAAQELSATPSPGPGSSASMSCAMISSQAKPGSLSRKRCATWRKSCPASSPRPTASRGMARSGNPVGAPPRGPLPCSSYLPDLARCASRRSRPCSAPPGLACAPCSSRSTLLASSSAVPSRGSGSTPSRMRVHRCRKAPSRPKNLHFRARRSATSMHRWRKSSGSSPAEVPTAMTPRTDRDEPRVRSCWCCHVYK